MYVVVTWYSYEVDTRTVSIYSYECITSSYSYVKKIGSVPQFLILSFSFQLEESFPVFIPVYKPSIISFKNVFKRQTHLDGAISSHRPNNRLLLRAEREALVRE